MRVEKRTSELSNTKRATRSDDKPALVVTPLGKRLRELSAKAVASGVTTMSNKQLLVLISQVRGRAK